MQTQARGVRNSLNDSTEKKPFSYVDASVLKGKKITKVTIETSFPLDIRII